MSGKATLKISLLFVFLLSLNVPLVLAKESGDEIFVTSETKDGISVSNGAIELKFSSAENGFGLKSITRVEGDFEFLYGNKESNNLWLVEFKHASNTLRSIDNMVECDRSHKIERSKDGSSLTLHLYWDSIALETENKVINVHATIMLDKTAFSKWRINVENNSKRFGTWEVTYPIINGLKASEEDEMYMAIPDLQGCLYKSPFNIKETIKPQALPPYVLDYPSARCTMQFSTLFEGKNNNGLYLATNDSRACVKKYGYSLDETGKLLKYSIRNYPEEMGVPGSESSYQMPYEVIVGVYEGDWMTAAKIYRNWALDQKWCAKGKISQRTDMPKWYLDTPLWFAGRTTDKMIPLAKFLDVPVAYQWYRWYDFPSSCRADPDYIEYIPDFDKFSQQVKELKNSNIYSVPYIDSRFWATCARSWKEENAQRAACKVPANSYDDLLSFSSWTSSQWKNLMIYMEYWGGKQQAVMCPYTDQWQNKNSDVVTRLISEFGVDGVYLDQTASCQPAYCFDPDHGHPLGGGSHWVDGNRKLVEISRENAKKVNPNIILTTEDIAEPYIDVFDGLLARQTLPEMIPLFDFVYSGYSILFGRETSSFWGRSEPSEYSTGLAFMIRNAQAYLWGEQMGWFDPHLLDPDSPEAGYLKVMCKSMVKEDVKKFLFFSEMIRPPELEGDNPVLKAAMRPGRQEVEMFAVSHSAWKADDGTLGLVFTNLDGKRHKIKYVIDTEDYDLPNSKGYIAKIVDGDGVGKVEKYDSGTFERVETMAPYSVIVIEIKAN